MNPPDRQPSANATRLHVLIVEDSDDDAVLVARTLRRAGYEISYERVDTPEAMREALTRGGWDVVLADYVMPRFSGLDALSTFREAGLDLPFIVVSGRVGEDAAVEAMKAGAHDYVMKDHLKRLVPAVERELRDARVRAERRQAAEQLEAERERFHAVLELLPAGLMLVAPDHRIVFANRFYRERFGELSEKRCYESMFNRGQPCEVCETLPPLEASFPREWEQTAADGRDYHIFHFPFADSDGTTLTLSMAVDVTERLRAQEELRRHREHLEELVKRRTEEIESRNTRLAAEIADRKQAEEALRRSENQLRTLNETLERRVAERTAEVQEQSEQLRALASDLSQAEQQERRRIAKILHDHIQQLLVAARMHLDALKRKVALEQALPLAQTIGNILGEAIEASRSLAVELSPPILHDAGLIAALKWLAERMAERNQFLVELRCDGSAEPAAEEIRLLLFESVRELLLNALKHSGQTHAAVTVERAPGRQIKVTVADTGKGFDPAQLSERRKKEPTIGLFSIQQRLVHLGGEVQIEAAPGRGVVVTLVAPLAVSALERRSVGAKPKVATAD
jgi:two-component system sensor histidine kinase UhpB